MAIDAALLRAAQQGGAYLRLYRWDPPCLSFGRNEPALTRYDQARITTLGLDTVRRPTGGRAVWHEAEVTYAVAAPIDLFGPMRNTYVAIHEVIAAGLRTLGVAAALAPRATHATRLAAGACFASPAGGEIVVDGRKLVGSAQVRVGSAFLQHGSVLLEDRQDTVARVTRGPAPTTLATSLRAVLGRPVPWTDAATAIARAARDAWGGHWEHATMTVAPDNHFANACWTWRR